ncbi:endolytic transglycosylase MltG [Haliea sp. E1-2-M8]|uniref:endolytic transglycosylase MltG n=1 Tax=Haliea sp. E1-2-M8 TaxID=3064706 RepID=UPI00271D9FCA|nr:endolytic transglycosylase MltG [Haliea sp. E1-2-M8]MDO8862327.1 endolytic transglycosylase MltG [Haliea sp. E1-2-M8]
MRKLALIVLVATVLLALVAREAVQRWQAPLNLPENGMVLTVEPGDSLRSVASRLREQGVLPHPELLVAWARYHGLDARIRQGEYQLAPGLDARSLLDLMVSGRVIQYQVTLPEGIVLSRALAILAEEPALDSVLAGADDLRLLQLVAPHESPEGLFLPESYRYDRGATDFDILQRAHQALLQTLASEWERRAPDLPYATPYEALIMASIIERETGVPEEREEIAGVFVRRLGLGMRLQTDPTIIYGLGESFDGNLRRTHLRDADNLFNTYRHDGLPPTPIALPGRAAIRAALQPAAGDALFFVARGDGSHEFNATLEGHEQAVRKYQLQRRDDYRSTPETQ